MFDKMDNDPNSPTFGTIVTVPNPNHPDYEDWVAYIADPESVDIEETELRFYADYMDVPSYYAGDPNELPLITIDNGEAVEFEGFTIVDHPFTAVLVDNSTAKFEECIFKEHGTGSLRQVFDFLGDPVLDEETGEEIYAPSITYSSTDITNAITADHSASVALNNCTFTDNVAHSKGGAAVYARRGSIVDIYHSHFADNYSMYHGGAIYSSGSIIGITDSEFSENSTKFYGGCLYIVDTPGDGSYIRDSIFTENESNIYGGVGYIKNAEVQVVNNLFNDNLSSWYGAVLYLDSPVGEFPIVNCTFDENFALVAGGAVYVTGVIDEIKFYNNIFTYNTGYAIYEEHAGIDTSLHSNLFYQNDSDYWDEGIIGYIGAAQLNNIAGADGRNLDRDPMYVCGYNGRYYLSNTDAGQVLDDQLRIADDWASSATSPCVNWGTALALAYDTGSNEFYKDLADLSTRTDNTPDDGSLDVGFHYTDPNGIYGGTYRV